ncbi:MAG: site-specific DNA-methyltransferase [Halieaceae bacterium]|nr:site-specific DNA-methyltransferase [Halieaceae bacterium]
MRLDPRPYPDYDPEDSSDDNKKKARFRHEQLSLKVLVNLINSFGRMTTTSVPCVVVDPFFGTGSAAVAARATGCHFIGNDADPLAVDVAEGFLADEKIAEKWYDTCWSYNQQTRHHSLLYVFCCADACRSTEKRLFDPAKVC